MEKLDDSHRHAQATKKQQALIEKILRDFPEIKGRHEYEDFQRDQTVGNASEFITMAIEENLDAVSDTKTYADYIATRPRAERFGSHGLFTDDGVQVQLSKVSQELNSYTGNTNANTEGETLRLGNPCRFWTVMLLLWGLLLLTLLLNVNIGSVSIRAGDVFSMLWDGIRHGVGSSTESQILFSIRIPRMLLAAILGGALSVSGYLLQVFFRNPIAGPFVLGISSGAKMVVGITLIFLVRFMGNISPLTLILAAFLGSLLITSVVLLFAQKVHSMSMLLVIGIMVGYICGAVTDFCVTFADDHDVVNLTNWSMGTFSGASWENVKLAALLCIPGVLGALALCKPISAYALGEGYAQSMGIRVKPFRVLLIALSSLLSACVTALAGPISFVGIAVPHITRSLLKSAKPAYVIPAAFFCGAVFCVFCDLIARTVFAPTELAIGTVTSIFGAPVVIYMMVKRKRNQEV